ncbi:hypothetical protein E2P81_ATG03685 [Venturia nashicola]|uniref:Uncharacterized protein n=1 Tax=Venturia nashicola TaxID=86259 RepID=A0A4Z1PJV1_9PEZI|nr:hypothetical protein E6O75_ATG03759 [Venturia nashicola]TLD38010.1 hypothetical protein E2P81_ATG03685 [Venturia nashicola]
MGATASSIPLTPQQTMLPTSQNSSPVTSPNKVVSHEDERIPYPSPESHYQFHELEPYAEDENGDSHIKDEDMSDVLSSVEETLEDGQEEAQSPWKVVHLGAGVMKFYTSSEVGSLHDDSDSDEDDLAMGNVADDSYDANDRYANLDVDEKRQQEELLEAAEKPEEEEFDMAAFMNDQWARGRKMIANGWKHDTVDAYLLIERRERVVLFPDSWRSQFPQFPADLFSNRSDPDAGLLRALTPCYDTTMKWAITKFFELGPRVRDNLGREKHSFYKRRPEGLVEQHVKHYAKMAYKDVGIERDVRKKHIPELFTFASAMYDTTSEILEEMIVEKLRRRADRVVDLLRITEHTPKESIEAATRSIHGREPTLYHHRGEYYLYEPPTLYGIVSKQTVFALVAYEPLGVVDNVRQMAWFQLSKDVFDVWNCIALALMIIWCRHHMLNILELLPKPNNDEAKMEVNDRHL